MSIRKVKTAVVGCGMISSIYIRNLSRMFSVIDLAAVCNIHKEAAEARAKEFGIAKAMSIDELELSVRSYNCLKRAGINTVSELTNKTSDEMMKVRNLGRKSLEEVLEKLKDLGLKLKAGETILE